MPAPEIQHTFVICAYGKSMYLEECIQSLLAQSVKSQIILATSTPNDLIQGMAEKYGIPLRINQGPGGIAQDWNYAYAQSSTKFITLAHQDDIYEPEYTACALKDLSQAKDPLIWFSDYYEIRHGQRVTKNRLLFIKRLLISPLRLKALQRITFAKRCCLALGNSICCPAVTFAASSLPKEIFTPHFRSNVDWQAWERFSRMRGSFQYHPHMLMGHRIHGDSETSKVIGDSQRSSEDLELFRKFWPLPVARRLAQLYASGEKSNKG